MENQTHQLFTKAALTYWQQIKIGLQQLAQGYNLLQFNSLLQATRNFKQAAAQADLIDIYNLGSRLEKLLIFLWQRQIPIDLELSMLLRHIGENLRLILFQIETGEVDQASSLAQGMPVLKQLEAKLDYNFGKQGDLPLLKQSLTQKSWKNKLLGRLILFLEPTASRPDILIKEVLAWTGGQPLLTRKLCQLILNAQIPIAVGEETKVVEQLVKTKILSQPTSVITGHFSQINNQIKQAENREELLKLYRQILQTEVDVENSSQQQKLQTLGLVIEKQGKLKVANRIYAAVFNLQWVNQELNQLMSRQNRQKPITLQISGDSESSSATEKPSLATESVTFAETQFQDSDKQLDAERAIFDRIAWRSQTVLANLNGKSPLHLSIAIVFALFVIAAAWQEMFRQLPIADNYCNSKLLEKVDNAIFLQDKAQLESVIVELQQLKQQFGEDFDVRCYHKLYDAQYNYALKLASSGYDHLFTTINLLCQIPRQYYLERNINPWFARWSNLFRNTDFSARLEQYLSNNDCPAATYLNQTGQNTKR